MNKRKPTYLSFKISKENYAVSTSKVMEVLEPQYITPVPNALEFIKGLITFRGSIIPVVCLHQKLNLSIEKVLSRFVIIIFDTVLNHKKVTIAAIADSVNEVITMTDDRIMPVPETGIMFDSDYLTGMLNHNDTYALILDIDKILAYNN